MQTQLLQETSFAKENIMPANFIHDLLRHWVLTVVACVIYYRIVFLLLDDISITVWYHPLISVCKTSHVFLCYLHSVSLRCTKNFMTIHLLMCLLRRGLNCKSYRFGASYLICFEENYHASSCPVARLYLALIFTLMDIFLLPTGWKITFLVILCDLAAELHYQIIKFTKLLITKLLIWLLNTLGYLHMSMEERPWMNLLFLGMNFTHIVKNKGTHRRNIFMNVNHLPKQLPCFTDRSTQNIFAGYIKNLLHQLSRTLLH